MKKLLLFCLGIALGRAQTPAPTETAAAPSTPAPTPVAAPRPPIDTHGVDMRTQAGPPGPRYSPPVPVDEQLPTLWLIGDSTVRNGSAGGGTSARSFYNANWKRMVDLIKAGDVVMLQFGTNDGGDPTRGVGEIRGIGE